STNNKLKRCRILPEYYLKCSHRYPSPPHLPFFLFLLIPIDRNFSKDLCPSGRTRCHESLSAYHALIQGSISCFQLLEVILLFLPFIENACYHLAPLDGYVQDVSGWRNLDTYDWDPNFSLSSELLGNDALFGVCPINILLVEPVNCFCLEVHHLSPNFHHWSDQSDISQVCVELSNPLFVFPAGLKGKTNPAYGKKSLVQASSRTQVGAQEPCPCIFRFLGVVSSYPGQHNSIPGILVIRISNGHNAPWI
ncbi:hypothetical protein HAX54_018827, partial [Datura stramonium]|nr:hypothetical protein [Datura stramonium]